MDKKYAEYLLDNTKKNYNLTAEEFSRTRWNIRIEFNVFRGYINSGDKILDVVCGNGRFLKLLRSENIDYIGVDASEKLIKIAKQKYPRNKFLVANALKLPFSKDSFDKVFLIAVLHNVPSEKFRLQILKEIKRVLKPGGLLILTVWHIWRKEAIALILKYLFLKLVGKSKLDIKDVFKPWGERKINRYYHFFTKREICNLAKKAGFEIMKTGAAKNEKGKRLNIYLIARKP
jgi:ubiquinone/menaquinone biosynthesis C-methylase UbiE